MLKRKALNRIFVVTISLGIVFTIYTISRIISKNSNVEYNYYNNDDNCGMVYLPNTDDYLVKSVIYVDDLLPLEKKVYDILEAMVINNNKNSLLPSNIKPILPLNTKINNVKINGDILSVDFSPEFLNANDEQFEMIISSLTYTLTEFSNISGVEITSDEKILKYIPNSLKKLPTIFTRDYGINFIYDISSNRNIEKVFLYYFDDNSYVVPVTKYLNSDKDKIEIIIESLVNPKNYKNNLISFLDYDLKLISYKLGTNVLNLNFNKIINSDGALSNLSRSIFANYDIKTINFFANNNKFLEKNIEK